MELSYLDTANTSYIETQFERYRADPNSVEPSWRFFFDGLGLGASAALAQKDIVGPVLSNEAKVAELINAYRELGRLIAHINPLSEPPHSHPLLSLQRFGLSEADLGKTFTAGKLVGLGTATLNLIIEQLKKIYCGTVGVEYTHIQNTEERSWLRQKLESPWYKDALDLDTRKFILLRLTQSESFERFLHTRYVAQKRFSLEGAESTIVAIDRMIESVADLGAQQIILGMAHRGRLNVLANVIGKKPEQIFTEFEGTYKIDTSLGEGDVKYHMGFESDRITRQGKQVHLWLLSNPSHLEFVNPVIEGIVRARQTALDDRTRSSVVPILIHGDAAFSGQGVCYETLNLSRLRGYSTGGTLHIVINNQIGFTATPEDSRSTTYSTDLAKMLEVPIFHVNADDPEAVWRISGLCAEYRTKFNKDVFIDLICYRKHGHNEADEPSFTQPIMYKKIAKHASTRDLYAAGFAEDEAQKIKDEITASLTQAHTKAKTGVVENQKPVHVAGEADLTQSISTVFSESRLRDVAERLASLPEGFKLHPKLGRLLDSRLKSVRHGENIDWGNAEALCFATLLIEKYNIRISGQDSERGTFTHRHAVLNDFESGAPYIPLAHIAEEQGRFEIYNSPLSEAGVLGFEFGFSMADPGTLVIWEAQFGDFANGAQVIIDQFITTAESKWQTPNGLVLLLPHGFEGQGPEHSSARLERFLQLCGKNNISVCNPTTPAQLFHLLRRQMKRPFRKPLVVMSPKSLLRHRLAVSDLTELSDGRFYNIIEDTPDDISKVEKILVCTGKIFYDLIEEMKAASLTNITLIRIEQLYPWPVAELSSILKKYPPSAKIIWVQEEPRNMGAWNYVSSIWNGIWNGLRDRQISYIGRDICAAPAVGSAKIHEIEKKEILAKAIGEPNEA